MRNKIWILVVLIIVYFLFKYTIPYWNYVIYPINLFVTFLHEFWHSLFAIVTGWGVLKLEVNSDGSGLATTSWWIRAFIVMWWYIGSAIFWNILLYIWFKSKKISSSVLYILSWLMVFASIFWFSDFANFLILLILAWILWLLAYKTDYDQLILQFLWVTSILYIIEDFDWWPSSDLANFSEIFIIIPQVIWMYIWLIIVILITGFNLKLIFKK